MTRCAIEQDRRGRDAAADTAADRRAWEAVQQAGWLVSEMRSGALRDIDLVVEVGSGDVAIDLANVAFLDCIALGALMEASERLAAMGVALRLRNPRANVARILALTDLAEAVTAR